MTTKATPDARLLPMARRLARALKRPGTRLWARLACDDSGVAVSEFALALPLVMYVGGAGIEYSNMALVNLRINQVALSLADNASRVGLTNSALSIEQLRETDINDVMQGARLEAGGLNLTKNGRVTLSSLENVQRVFSNGTTATNDTAPVQRIHWQRCIGLKSGTGYDSSYGTTTITAGSDATVANAGTLAPNGMGDTGYLVSAPSTTGVMFVEVNYLYQPLFGTLYSGAMKLHSTASLIVRDNRDFSQIFNPTPTATAQTCNLYNL